MVGKAESASPGGRPFRPALIGYCPSIVVFWIGTQKRLKPKLIWFNTRALATQVCLTWAVVMIS